MTISLNNIGDDGPLGSSANVLGIETVMGTLSDDILSGGDAADTLDGRDGNDRIDARGGGADTVICGPGAADVAIVDETDSVTGCEQVELPQPDGGETDAGPVDPPATAVVDVDGDGVVAGVDCDDTRAAIRPGARDVPGNKIDERLRRRRRAGVAGRRPPELRLHGVPQRHDTRGPADRPRAPGRRARRAALQRPLLIPQEGRQGQRQPQRQPPQADPRPPAHRGDARGPPRRPPARSAAWSASKMRKAKLPKRTRPVPAARRAGGALRVRRAGA